MTAAPHSGAYGWLMLAGIGVSLVLWSRLTRRDARLIPVYLGALAGAFLGAKLVYLAAEGWLHWHDPNCWVILATGKCITGALLGHRGQLRPVLLPSRPAFFFCLRR